MRLALFILAVVALGLLPACGGPKTTDPRAGGLYSYDPEAYEQRLAERRERLTHLEQQEAAEAERREELETEVAEKRAERDELAAEVAAVEADVERIQKAIYETEAQTEQHNKKLWQLNVNIKKVKQDIKLLKASAGREDIAAREQELARLKSRLDELLREAELLTGI
jgi:chromosome segregation ATPase